MGWFRSAADRAIVAPMNATTAPAARVAVADARSRSRPGDVLERMEDAGKRMELVAWTQLALAAVSTVFVILAAAGVAGADRSRARPGRRRRPRRRRRRPAGR
jgi:hypothetical protein